MSVSTDTLLLPARLGHALQTPTFRRWLGAIGLLVIALTCAGILTGLALADAPPAWWRRIDPEDPGVDRAARRIENQIVNTLYARREDPPAGPQTWELTLPAEDVNAWLSARFRPWLASMPEPVDWPEDLGDVQVRFGPGHITVGVGVNAGEDQRVLSARVCPTLGEDGRLWLPATQVYVGRLALPTELVADAGSSARYMPEDIRHMPETGAMLDAFAGKAPIAESALIRLEDGRRVRVVDLHAEPGQVVLTCTTER